jgi:hydrogenase large subunit
MAVATKHEPVVRHLERVLGLVKGIGKFDVPLAALHSTLGRHAARAVMCAVNVDILARQWQLLLDNIKAGDADTFNKPVFPKHEITGFGFHEAPRGMLSHWVVIHDGVIKNYQAVVPTTWNAAPRNEADQMGPYEASLVGTPLADPERPLEVLRTVHSFDPCLACAVHLVDTNKREIVKVRAL